MLNLMTIVVTLIVLAVAARHLQARWRTGSASEALVVAWRRLWPAKPLTWAQLERRSWRRILASMEPSVSGAIIVPETVVVWMAPTDVRFLGTSAAAMEQGLKRALDKRAATRAWVVPPRTHVVIRVDEAAFDGEPRIEKVYGAPPAEAVDLGATEVITDELRTEPDRHDPLETQPMDRFWIRMADGTNFELAPRPGHATIGRGRDTDLHLPDASVSRVHASLTFRSGAWWLADEGSRNGTFHQGSPVGPGSLTALADGDLIRLGGDGPTLQVCGEPIADPAGSAERGLGRRPVGARERRDGARGSLRRQ